MQGMLHKVRRLFELFFGGRKTIRLGIYGEPNTGKTTLANRISLDWLGEPVGKVSEVPHETREIQKKEHIEVKVGNKKLIINLLDMPGLATKVDYKDLMKYKSDELEDKTKEQILSILPHEQLRKIADHHKIEVHSSKKKLAEAIDKRLGDEEFKKTLIALNISRRTKKFTKAKAKARAKEATEGIIEAIKWLDNVDTVLVMMDATKDPYTQVNLMLIGNLEAKKIPLVIVANKTDLAEASVDRIKESFENHPVVSISALRGDNLDNLYKAIAEHSKI